MKKDQETKRNRKASKLLKCDGKTLRQIIVSKGYVVAELSRMIGYCDDYLNRCIRRNDISDVCVKKLIDYKIFPQMYDVEGEIKVDKDDNKTTKDILDVHAMRDIVLSHASEELKAETDKEVADWLNRNAIYGIPKPDKEIEFGTPYGIVRSEKDLRRCIKQAIGPKSQNLGTNLIAVRDMLENACFNEMPYNLEDMRNDLLAFAANVAKYPKKWVDFVRRMSLQYEPDRKRTPFDPTAQEVKKVLNEKYGRLENAVEGIDYGYGPAPKNPSYYAAGHDIAKGVFKLMQAAMDDLKHDREFKELIKQAVKEAYEEL